MTTDTLFIDIKADDNIWDPVKRRFLDVKDTNLELKHSLYSIRMWEGKHKKPFLHMGRNLSNEEFMDYVKCMTINKNISDDVYYAISTEQAKDIYEYIEDSKTATWFREEDGKKKPDEEIITAERVYSWMRKLNIPFECEKWHLSQLMTLIHVAVEDDKPEEEKEIDSDFYRKRKAENERRIKEYEKRKKEKLK